MQHGDNRLNGEPTTIIRGRNKKHQVPNTVTLLEPHQKLALFDSPSVQMESYNDEARMGKGTNCQ